MKFVLHSSCITLASVLLIAWQSISGVYGQENRFLKTDKVPRDLEVWEIVLDIRDFGRPSDSGFSKVSLKSDGKLIVENGLGRKDDPQTSKTGESQLDKGTLRKAIELASAAIENKKGWHRGESEEGTRVGLAIKSKELIWGADASHLNRVREVGPELSRLIDLLDGHLKSGPKILDHFDDGPRKTDQDAQNVLHDLKDWTITLSVGGGTPGDASHSEVFLKSDGKLIVENGRGRKERPRSSKTGEAQLDKLTLHRAMNLATAAIENSNGWRAGKYEDGSRVSLTIKSGNQSWSRSTRDLGDAREAAPDLGQLIDLLDKQLKNGPSILDHFAPEQ